MYEMSQVQVTRPKASLRARLIVIGLVVSMIGLAVAAVVILNGGVADATGLCGGG